MKTTIGLLVPFLLLVGCFTNETPITQSKIESSSVSLADSSEEQSVFSISSDESSQEHPVSSMSSETPYHEANSSDVIKKPLSYEATDDPILSSSSKNQISSYSAPPEYSIIECNDGIDNDHDGNTDCFDDDCKIFEFCSENSKKYCEDSLDNDNDGDTDCEDLECKFYSTCSETTYATCIDSIDNDLDGTVDCLDSDCKYISGAFCGEITLQMCEDGLDNDNDGTIDCDDSDCDCAINKMIIQYEEYCKLNSCIENGIGDSTHSITPTCNDNTIKLPQQSAVSVSFYLHSSDNEFDYNQDENLLRTGMVGDNLVNGRPTFKENLWNNTRISEWWSEEHATSMVIKNLLFRQYGISNYIFSNPNFYYDEPNYDFTGTGGRSAFDTKSFFTTHMQLTFVFDGQEGQYFEMIRNDDFFIFVNGKLISDFGGVHQPLRHHLNINTTLQTLDVPKGDSVTLDVFMAQRSSKFSEALFSFAIPCLFQL